MAKYILIYKSPEGFNPSSLPKEQIVQSMKAWGEWLGALGPKVVDRGDMFKSGAKSLGKDGVITATSAPSGYSIIDVLNYDEALEAAAGSPAIQNGGRVEVYEAFGI